MASLRCALNSSRDRTLRAIERNEEAVTCRIDLASAMFCERFAQESPVVSADRRKNVVAESSHEVRRPLDVAGKERHCPLRQAFAAHIDIFPAAVASQSQISASTSLRGRPRRSLRQMVSASATR